VTQAALFYLVNKLDLGTAFVLGQNMSSDSRFVGMGHKHKSFAPSLQRFLDCEIDKWGIYNG